MLLWRGGQRGSGLESLGQRGEIEERPTKAGRTIWTTLSGEKTDSVPWYTYDHIGIDLMLSRKYFKVT